MYRYKKQFLPVIMICFIAIYIFANIKERKSNCISNQAAVLETDAVDNCTIIEQDLNIFHDDREIKAIDIKLNNKELPLDCVDIELACNGEIVKGWMERLSHEDDWYRLHFNLDRVEGESAKLVLKIIGDTNVFDVPLAVDIDGIGNCRLNGKLQGGGARNTDLDGS